ncbi:MAG: CBS domain-containing protein, partial [Planctomycetes bacterium]|nr:CBS domain-containing protein [Planctomycetota bacterium]
EGIDFGAADGVPVRLIVLFVMPKGPSALYLQALAGFSALVGNTYHLQHLCGCVTPEEVISYVEATGIRIREQLALKDVMLPTIHTITPEHSIKEAVVCLCQLHLESLPIVDSEGALLGEITGTQLVKMGLAGYLSLLGNASVLNSPDLFENFLRLHGDGKVGTLMSKRPLTIPIEASLFEAGLRLVNSNATQAFVVKGKTLAGILKMDDFVKRLILGKGL